MTQQDTVNFWKLSAEESVQTAKDNQEKHPEWAFFFWHLAIEKILKSLIVKSGKTPLPVHDLVRLASITPITLTLEQSQDLAEISTYAISARYDDYKKSYYNKVTKPDYKKV